MDIKRAREAEDEEGVVVITRTMIVVIMMTMTITASMTGVPEGIQDLTLEGLILLNLYKYNISLTSFLPLVAHVHDRIVVENPTREAEVEVGVEVEVNLKDLVHDQEDHVRSLDLKVHQERSS